MKEGLHLVLCVMSKSSGIRVLNIENMDGLTDDIRAFSFSAKGEPILQLNDPKGFYKLSGAMTGTVNLNAVYSHGVEFNGHKMLGYEAVAALLSNQGLGISVKEVEDAVVRCIKDGMNRIYVFRECWFHQLQSSYGFFSDGWEFSGRPDSDLFDSTDINKILKRLGSNWRVYSKKLVELLQKKEFQKLVSASDI